MVWWLFTPAPSSRLQDLQFSSLRNHDKNAMSFWTMPELHVVSRSRRDLKAARCERIFADQVSSVGARAKLTTVLEFVLECNVLASPRSCF